MFGLFKSGVALGPIACILAFPLVATSAISQVLQSSGGGSPSSKGLAAISITQKVLGQGGTFEFLVAGFDRQAFSLAPRTNQSDSISFDNLAPGVFTVFKKPNPGYKLENVKCLGDGDGGNYIDTSRGVIEFDLDAGESQSCVFYSVQVVENAEQQNVDLMLGKSVSDVEFNSDLAVWDVQYRLEVRNEGSAFSYAAGIELSDSPQIGVELISTSGNGWQCNDTDLPLAFPSSLHCEFEPGGGHIGAAEMLPPLKIQARISEAGTFRNCATVRANADLNLSEIEPANNQTCVDVEAAAPPETSDLEISLSGPSGCRSGGSCKVDVSIVNVGNQPFAGPVIFSVAADPHELSGRLPTDVAGWNCFKPDNASAVCGSEPLSVMPRSKVELSIPFRVPNTYRAGDVIQSCAGFASLNDVRFPSDIHELQLLLNMSSYNVGSVDGQKGSRTRRGEAAYRRASAVSGTASVLGNLRATFSNLAATGGLGNGQSCVQIDVEKAAVRNTPQKPPTKSCVLPEVRSPITGQCVDVISTCPFGSVLNVFNNQCIQILP